MRFWISAACQGQIRRGEALTEDLLATHLCLDRLRARTRPGASGAPDPASRSSAGFRFGLAPPGKQPSTVDLGLAGRFLTRPVLTRPAVSDRRGRSRRGGVGARIGNRTAVETYSPSILTIAVALIGLGYRQLSLRTKPHCADGAGCARSSYPFFSPLP